MMAMMNVLTNMNLSLIVEIVLSVLLLCTISYSALLERRLSALRKGQDGLKDTIVQLNEAIISAGSSMRMLKSAAAGAAEALDERIARGRGLADELGLLTSSGERIAERMDRNTSSSSAAKAPIVMPAALAARLEAMKPGARPAARSVR
jgi:ABC-type multidrug transport system fused ATPase/permease subunit